MDFNKKDYDRLLELMEGIEPKDTNKELLKLGLISIALGGVAIPFTMPVALGLGALGGVASMIGLMGKDNQVAMTVDLPKNFSELIPKEEVFEHINVKNIYGESPTFSKVDMIDKAVTFIYDVPFGLIDEDFEKSKSRIAKLLGCDDVELEFENNKLYIKHKKTAKFKDFYTYEPIYYPKSTNFNVLIGMVEQDGTVKPYSIDFTKEPHMLLAGTTGKGKSTLLNCLIINLMINYTSKELQLFLVDFKGGVEFSTYEDCSHVRDVIWEKDQFKKLLDYIEYVETPKREKLFKPLRCKNIGGYNGKVEDDKKIPYITIILDEFAQLSPTDDKGIIDQLVRLIGKTRFVGIFFILATQRPSANIITNDIKANLSNIVSLGVSTIHDTKCIFGENEVELHKVKGKGKGYLRQDGEYKYFSSFYLGVNPSDKSEQERTIEQLLTKFKLYKEEIKCLS